MGYEWRVRNGISQKLMGCVVVPDARCGAREPAGKAKSRKTLSQLLKCSASNGRLRDHADFRCHLLNDKVGCGA
jgi:hypothetical protein